MLRFSTQKINLVQWSKEPFYCRIFRWWGSRVKGWNNVYWSRRSPWYWFINSLEFGKRVRNRNYHYPLHTISAKEKDNKKIKKIIMKVHKSLVFYWWKNCWYMKERKKDIYFATNTTIIMAADRLISLKLLWQPARAHQTLQDTQTHNRCLAFNDRWPHDQL